MNDLAGAFARAITQMGPCNAALSGQGYWTCDVPGGCSDCRSLAREINDTEQIATWNAERAEGL